MPWRGFLTASLLANLGISATYAAVGASAARAGSFLLFFAGMVLLPAAALWLVRSATARREHSEGNQTRS